MTDPKSSTVNEIQIINAILQEDKKIQHIPESIKQNIIDVANYLKVEQYRVATEALIIGIEAVREKYRIPELV